MCKPTYKPHFGVCQSDKMAETNAKLSDTLGEFILFL